MFEPRHQQQMGQEQTTVLPTALDWDADGELCPDDLQCLLDRLQAGITLPVVQVPA